MLKKIIIEKQIFAIYILIICVTASLSNYSFALGYYGTHNSHLGHHSNHHSSFGHHSSHHGKHHSNSLHRHHNNRLHSSLYNYCGSRLHGQHYDHRNHNRHRYYDSYINSVYIYVVTPSISGNEKGYYEQNNNKNYFMDRDTNDRYEYGNKEPYVYVYGKEYIPGDNAYVFQYDLNDQQDQSLYTYNGSNN